MLKFAIEKFAPWYSEAKELFQIHYEELAQDKETIKLSLDVKPYEDAEAKGTLHIVTARDDGKIVGYYVGGLSKHLHYADAGVMISTDMYFLLPDYRKGNEGIKFFAFIEKSVRERGCTKMYITCKKTLNLAPMLEEFGFKNTDYVFTKLLLESEG